MKLVLIPGKLEWLAQRANINPPDFAKKLAQLAVMLICTCFLFALGLWDDIKHLGPKFKCLGDPAVLGLFDDPKGNFYVLAVNRNPVECASISLDPSLDDAVPHKWHPLEPGEGRLFRVPADGPPEVV